MTQSSPSPSARTLRPAWLTGAPNDTQDILTRAFYAPTQDALVTLPALTRRLRPWIQHSEPTKPYWRNRQWAFHLIHSLLSRKEGEEHDGLAPLCVLYMFTTMSNRARRAFVAQGGFLSIIDSPEDTCVSIYKQIVDHLDVCKSLLVMYTTFPDELASAALIDYHLITLIEWWRKCLRRCLDLSFSTPIVHPVLSTIPDHQARKWQALLRRVYMMAAAFMALPVASQCPSMRRNDSRSVRKATRKFLDLLLRHHTTPTMYLSLVKLIE